MRTHNFQICRAATNPPRDTSILHMARRTGSESNTIQAQEIFSVGFNLPAFVAETMCTIGSVFRP